MGLNFQNPRLYSKYNIHGELQTFPAVSDEAHNETQFHDRLNEDITANTVPWEVGLVLARAGYTGGPITTDEIGQLMSFVDVNGSSYLHNMWEVYRNGGGTVPVPPPLPPPPVQGSELYESGHEISNRLPKGTKIKRAVGAFETCWGGINAFIQQARVDGVPDGEDELAAAREGLLVFFDALNAAYANGEDTITDPAVKEECQVASDRVWNAFHNARRAASAALARGYQMVEGDPRPPVFRYSRLNRIAWTALSNLTTACGLYGLRGELLITGTRAAEYVDAFVSWDSQDPLLEQTVGPGYHVPGSLAEVR